jgi:uncharacterized protein (TIGR03437 family)
MLRIAAICLYAGAALNGAAGPELSASNIVSSADYHSGAVAPSEIVVLYPSNAGPPHMATWALDPMHAQHSPGFLGETRVLFDNLPARIVYAMSGQICVIVPYRVSTRKTTQVVVEYEGQRSAPVSVPVVASAPALFTLDASGSGQAAMLNDTGCCNSVRNPAMRGRPATLYATGEGLPYPGDRQVKPPLPIRVTVGGVPAEVLWAHNLSVFQVNFRVPVNAPIGDAVPVVLTVGGARSSASVTMSVRSARHHILVVSSDPAVCTRLSAILAHAGYGVSTARDGEEAIQMSKDNNFDLVISDLASSGVDTEEMMRVIRSDRQTVKTAVIVERFTPDGIRTADLLGAQTVLTAPLAAQTVLPRVRALLRRPLAVY